ncbi:MAG: POTRA domain-containing protein [Stagnimonas sp.]|nr:POTRA domain-containing protein [Stagnimonas sp.]
MRSALRLALSAWLLLSGGLAAAGPEPVATIELAADRVAEIRFVGNRITRPKVMLRELPFAVGERIDVGAVERGRQAILDLGLFKAVTAERGQEPQGLVITYTVQEKFYVLPTPRLDANGDGQFAYGAQLSWDNLWGLDHSLLVYGQQRDQQVQGVGKETQYFLGYFAPFVGDSRWSLGFNAGYRERPVFTPEGAYEESFESAQVLATRRLSSGPPSQGWKFGTGLYWQRQDTSGRVPPYGQATAPVLSLSYRDLRFHVYSEEGLQAGARLEAAREGLASDYDYARLGVGATRFLEPGGTAHQNLNLRGDLGLNWQGPVGHRSYSLGGSYILRGYDPDFLEGDAYYRVAAEYLRPIGWRWLRLLVIAEAGAVGSGPGDLPDQRIYSSLGLGLRLRLPAFVNFEVEAGVALPLSGGGGLRVFGSRV